MHTRCPHCSTIFSISQQHLDVAGDQVRCGSCDQVFDGRDNVIDAQGNYVRKIQEEKTSEFETGADIFGMIEKASSEFKSELDIDPEPKVRSENAPKIDESWADALLAEEGFDDTPDVNTPPPVIETLTNNRNSQSIVSEPVSAPEKKKPSVKPARQIKNEQKNSSLPKSSANESQLSDEFLDLSSEDNDKNLFRDSESPIQKSTQSTQSKSAITRAKERKQKLEEELTKQDELNELDELNALRNDGTPSLDLSKNKNINNSLKVSGKAKQQTAQSKSAITKAKERKVKQQKELQENNDELFDQELVAELNEFYENSSEQSLPNDEKKILDEKSIQDEFGHLDKKAKAKKNKLGEELNNSTLINDLEEIADDLGNKDQVSELTLAVNAPVAETKTSSDAENEPGQLESSFEKPKAERLFELNFDTAEIIPDEPPAKPKRTLNRIFNSISILFVSLLLAFQFIYFNMDQFARAPQYRPFYQKACDLLPCTLPTLQNLNKIRGSHLVVRQHPDDDSALLIDIIMTNTAKYPQLFPIMEVVFTDGEHLPIKQRQLKPKEYLLGDLASLKAMPTGKPIHVSLEIVDPGPKAKGWEINFLTFLN